jgi:hypothetical protein
MIEKYISRIKEALKRLTIGEREYTFRKKIAETPDELIGTIELAYLPHSYAQATKELTRRAIEQGRLERKAQQSLN